MRYGVIGFEPPYKVQRELWQTQIDGTEVRVSSRTLRGSFASAAAARAHIADLRAGRASEDRAPRRAATAGLAGEALARAKHEQRASQWARKKAAIAELEAAIAAQEADGRGRDPS